MIRLYTEREIREEVSKRLSEELSRENLQRRLENMDCEIRELKERVWCLEHPPGTHLIREG